MCRALCVHMVAGQGEVTALLAWLRGEGQGMQQHQLEGLCIQVGLPLPGLHLVLQEEDWQAATKVVQPSAKREGFATVPGVTWAEVSIVSTTLVTRF